MSESEAPISALASVIRHEDALERLESDPETYLRELGLDQADREAMLAMGVDRLRAYRSLVQNRFRNVVMRFLPRTSALVGKPRMRAEITRFVHEEAAHSPYLRSIPESFVDWVAPRWSKDEDVPAWAEPLARYELLSETVPNSAYPRAEPTGVPIALDRGVLCNPSARSLGFEFAVDQVTEANPRAPEPESIRLIVCRDSQHRYREQRVDALGHELFSALSNGRSLQAAIFAAAQAIGEEVADPLLERATYALGELTEIEALLGASPPTASQG